MFLLIDIHTQIELTLSGSDFIPEKGITSGIPSCFMPISAFMFIVVEPTSVTSTSSSTSVMFLELHEPSDGVAYLLPHEPGRMCRESVQLCNTKIMLM